MKKLLLVPILTISLLVGCAKGNSYVPEDITLDAWLDGAEKTHNNMYNIYPEKQRPVDMDGNDAVDWDNYIIKTPHFLWNHSAAASFIDGLSLNVIKDNSSISTSINPGLSF